MHEDPLPLSRINTQTNKILGKTEKLSRAKGTDPEFDTEIFCVLRNLHCFQIDITSSLELNQDLVEFSVFRAYIRFVYLLLELCDKQTDNVKYTI